MADASPPPRLDYAGRTASARVGDPGVGAFVGGIFFLAVVLFVRGGLHNGMNPVGVLA